MGNISHLEKYHNTLCLSPQILHKHCFQFLLGLTTTPRENETMLLQNLGGQIKSIMVFSQVAYGIFHGVCNLHLQWNNIQKTKPNIAAASSKLEQFSFITFYTRSSYPCIPKSCTSSVYERGQSWSGREWSSSFPSGWKQCTIFAIEVCLDGWTTAWTET